MSDHGNHCHCASCTRQRLDAEEHRARTRRFDDLMSQVHALRAARHAQDAARDAADWRTFFKFACRTSLNKE